MGPVELRTERLTLSTPTLDDVDAITRHCQDPLFERYLTTPWPYTREDAVAYVGLVADWWAEGTDYSFGIRRDDGGLIGMVSFRTRGDVGFWMGAEHRRQGYMVEALAAVCEWVFVEFAGAEAGSGASVGSGSGSGSARRRVERIEWETLPGNFASAYVARAAGFRFTGTRPVRVAARDGSHPNSWHAELLRDDDRDPKPGWPL